MKRRLRLFAAIFASFFGLNFGLVPVPAAENSETRPNTVYIGMVHSLFPSMSESFLKPILDSFGMLMESQTGVPGRIVAVPDPIELGRMLADNKVKLAVFNGIEYGWAKQKNPTLSPLMVAINQDRHLQAYLVVREDSAVKTFDDAKGKTLVLSKNMRHHCNLFLERRCSQAGVLPTGFFSGITTLANAEKAIDEVIEGKCDCAVVDKLSFSCYQRLKPVRYAKLKTIERSPVFPAAVIAYNPATLDEATLKKFRNGLLEANKSIQGRHMMTLFKLTAFEAIPTDFEQVVAEAIKTYPVPVVTTSAKTEISEK